MRGLDASPQRAGGLQRASLLLLRGVEDVADPLHVRAHRLQPQTGARERADRSQEAVGEGHHPEHRAQGEVTVLHADRPDHKHQQWRARVERAHDRTDNGAEPATLQGHVDLVDEEVGPVLDGAVLRPRRLEALHPREQLVLVAAHPRGGLEALRHEAAAPPPGGDDDRRLERGEHDHERGDRRAEHHEDGEVPAQVARLPSRLRGDCDRSHEVQLPAHHRMRPADRRYA